MPYSHLNDFPAEIRQRAAAIRLACFDVDGTLTDGRLWFDEQGNELKAFHILDGMGLKLLQQYGVTVALITARNSQAAAKRGTDLGLAEIHIGVKNKLSLIDQLCKKLNINRSQVSFMGDDLPDLAAIESVGLAVAPINAHPWIRERVHWRTLKSGGEGAARELCDLILAAQDKAESVLNEYRHES